jgi:hypothetical protein
MTKKMFVWTLGVVLCSLLAGTALAKDDTSVSIWASDTPKVDGLADDWMGISRSVDSGTKVEYAFRNDADNLYILFVFKDPKTMSTISLTGLTLYFSPEGKKDKNRGINFSRKVVNADQLIAFMEKQGQTLTEERKQELRAKNEYFLFDCSLVDSEGKVFAPAVGGGQSLPPVFRLARSGQDVVYEFRLPMSKREEHPAAIGTSPGQAIKVGFEWGGLTQEMRAAMAARIGDQGAQARQGSGSFDGSYVAEGREDNRDSGASLASMLHGPKKHSFWVDLTLAASESK